MKTIKQLKTQFRQIANDKIPHHWLENLLLFILNKPNSFLITDDDYLLSDDEWRRLNEGLDKLNRGIPLAYIIGVQGFFGYEFFVNEHTLIPRPDTEVLVEAVLNFIHDKHVTNGKILDLGTGSGCIAISLAKALANFHVWAVDYSADALEVAKTNAHHLQVKNCSFVQSNWYENIEGKFDVIVSNPPYIDKDDEHLNALMAEPMTALVADNQGLSDIETIAHGADDYLNDGGLLAIEHGYNQSEAVQAILQKAGFKYINTIKDYGGNDRVTLGIKAI